VITRATLLTLTIALFACAPQTVEQRWGQAYEANRTGMIADPAAPGLEVGEGVLGTDGVTAEQIVETYRKEQAETDRTSGAPSIINIGTGAR
jgi:type IV pilus biogenesis protein CpaD/CtpE